MVCRRERRDGGEELRQRGIGAASAIVAIVIAGLIVYGIIYYGPDIWRAIQEGASGALSPTEVREHPNKYLGQEITIEGYYGSAGISSAFIGENIGGIVEDYPAEDFSGTVAVETSGIENVALIEGGRYRFKGILKQTDSAVLNILGIPVILEATQAEPI